jgi:hypothetical protein
LQLVQGCDALSNGCRWLNETPNPYSYLGSATILKINNYNKPGIMEHKWFLRSVDVNYRCRGFVIIQQHGVWIASDEGFDDAVPKKEVGIVDFASLIGFQ